MVNTYNKVYQGFFTMKIYEFTENVVEEVTLEDTQDFHNEYGYLGYADMFEAEYQGRKVKLNKPMQGDVKKFKVYVKNPKGNGTMLII